MKIRIIVEQSPDRSEKCNSWLIITAAGYFVVAVAWTVLTGLPLEQLWPITVYYGAGRLSN